MQRKEWVGLYKGRSGWDHTKEGVGGVLMLEIAITNYQEPLPHQRAVVSLALKY